MKGTKHFCHGCYPSCNRIIYDTQTSSLPIRTDTNIWKTSDTHRRDWLFTLYKLFSSCEICTLFFVLLGQDKMYRLSMSILGKIYIFI
jgi:hypothetical protein